MNLTLVRWAYGKSFTLGTLYGDGVRLATLERPWVPDADDPLRAGEPRISCVPDGEYLLRPHVSERYPADRHAYSLENPGLGVYYTTPIPPGQKYGRTAILMHSAVYVRHLEGCIGMGMHHLFGVEPALQEGSAAMRLLRASLGRVQHKLFIRPVEGTREVLL